VKKNLVLLFQGKIGINGGMMMSNEVTNKPWWKQLWPWLIISGPAIGFVGAAITIWFAFTKDVDQPIRDGIQKQGFKVEQVAK
jgi:hypothetical protein